MRLIFALVLVVGVGLAGFAAYLAQDRFAAYQAALENQQGAILETTEVVVVTRELRYGDQLRPRDVTVIDWPADFVPFGAFTSTEDLFPEGDALPRTVLRVMERNEPVLVSKVTAPGEDAGVASSLNEGMRAFALRIDSTSGVSGFLRPGDRVDVYWTGNARGEQVTRLIRTNVQIIAIDQNTDTDRNAPQLASAITVEAPPEDIAALAQAQASGRITLALVGVRDDTRSDFVEIDQNELLGIVEEAAPVREQAPEVCTVRTRRGADVVEAVVPCPDEPEPGR